MADLSKNPIAIFGTSLVVGVASGMFGIGGGVLLVPLLVLIHHFEQHRAQGTSLLALVPPTGLFAFLTYYAAREVDIRTGLLLIPGIFFGGIIGGRVAVKLSARRMRRVFASILFLLGTWEFIAPMLRH